MKLPSLLVVEFVSLNTKLVVLFSSPFVPAVAIVRFVDVDIEFSFIVALAVDINTGAISTIFCKVIAKVWFASFPALSVVVTITL